MKNRKETLSESELSWCFDQKKQKGCDMEIKLLISQPFFMLLMRDVALEKLKKHVHETIISLKIRIFLSLI